MLKHLAKGNTVALSLILLAFVITAITLGAFYLKPWQTKQAETISVSATGKIDVTPNIAIISASVESKNANLDLARKINEEKVGEIVTQLKNVGVDEKDIKTSNIQAPPGGPEIQIYPAPKRNPNAFSATLEIKVRNFDAIDEVIEILTKNGSLYLYGPNLTLSTEAQENAKSQAREKAAENARVKAEQLAKLSGRKLGKTVKITEQDAFFPVPYMAVNESDAAQKVSQIQPGQNEVTVTIQVVYELK